MTSTTIEEFMKGALVTWIRTFENDGGGSLTYSALADGVYLYDVMTQLTPRGAELLTTSHLPVLNRCPEDPHARLSNLTLLLNFIRSFYQEVLGQLVLSALPDVVKISRTPDTERGVEELKKVLMLVLGCAVQSPLKEDVVNNIKKLSIDTQHDIVIAIKEITENLEMVWPADWNNLNNIPSESAPKAFTVLLHNCRRLLTERDIYWQDLLKSLLGGGDDESSEASQENVHHLGVQLAQLKAQLRRLRQDYEEKSESNSELKEELEQFKTVVDKLRQENIELIQDARAGRAWRDEADILREKAAKVDSLESEVTRYRDKVADIDFFKARVEELREDNRILMETKEMLEEQLLSSRRKAEQVLELENTILQLKQKINHLNIERDDERDRFQQLIEENAQLHLTNKNSMNESATLSAQMDSLRFKTAVTGRNLELDIAEEANTRVLKLELENQRLEAELAELRQEVLHASADRLLELEKENKRLSLKVGHLQESSKNEKVQVLEIQQELQAKQKETIRLHDTISTIKANSERQTAELQKESSNLQELIDTLRERQQKTTEDRLVDVERENKELTDLNMNLKNQVMRLEYEKQQLGKITERLKETAEKLAEVEHQKTEIERENRDLHLAMNTFKESCQKYEKLEHDYASLEVEYSKVSRTLDNTKETLVKMENAQSEKLQLQAEVDRLNRSLVTLKSSSSKLADVELEKDQLVHHNTQLQKQISNLLTEKSKAEQMELEIMSSNTEIQKLKRTIENNQKKLLDMEKEKGEIEAENTKLLRTIETLKVSTRKLNEVERDLTEIEGVNDRLDRENRSLKKELDRLKATLEMKDNMVDEASSKASKIERENRKLFKEVETLRINDNRIKVLEQERRELDQQTVIERKTLSTLREDLVAEKVKTQQLSNQLETLNADLSKLGLNAANLSPPVSDADDERCKALESMLEETLKRSVEIREEKIASLESRLSESVSRNQLLRKQLLQVKSDYECLIQRHQEEGSDLSLDATREMSKLKDALSKSNQEKTTMETEVSALSSQNASYREQVCALQSQVTSLSNQNTVVSKHNATLQGENARLQVENTTLQSQSASIIAQNSSLQTSTAQLEAERDKAKRSLDDRNSRLSQLVNDHEALQKLHQQLTQEYESLTTEHNTLKISQKNLMAEAKLLKDRQTNLSSNEDELIRLRESLEGEMANLKKDSSSLCNLRAEHSRLKDDFRSLFSSNERLRIEYKNRQADYKSVKTENNSMKLKCTELGGELNEVRDQLATLDVETSKLTNKCQVLQDLNFTLEEDRRSLMSQVSLLLTQYHDLLTQTLEDKQHFHQEEKNFTDKLNNLRRQKEKLEEKIIQQYRKMDNSPHKKKGFGSNLVKRVRKAGNDLINKVPRSSPLQSGRSRSRGREDGEEECQDSSSLGSSHANDSLDSGSETRRSSPHLPPSPHDSQDSAGEGTPTDRKNSFPGLTPKSSRKSLPASISELFLSNSLGTRDSLSSEDIGSPSDTTESNKEDDGMISRVGSRPPSANGSGELSRAGSRKPLYILPDAESGSKNDSLSDQLRGRSSNRSVSSISLNHSRTSLVNGSANSIPGTPPSRNSMKSIAPPPPPPRSSTPMHSASLPRGDKKFGEDDILSPLTPKLPPRVDQNNKGAPQLPPRSRRGSNQTPDSSLSSSQPTSACGTPELRKKSSVLHSQERTSPPTPPIGDLPQKPPPATKDGVANSVWYEYGCV